MDHRMKRIEPWARLNRLSKVTTVALAVVGVALVSTGITADAWSWWNDAPFFTNIVSGVATACFGVPFALIVLSYITARQSELVRVSEARELKKRALSELVRYSNGLGKSESSTPIGPVLVQRLNTFRANLEAVEERAQSAKITGHFKGYDIFGDGEVIREPQLIEDARYAISTMTQEAASLQAYLEPTFSWDVDLRERWARLCAQWRLVDDYVRPRAYETGLAWIPDDLAGRFDSLMRNTAHPTISVFALRDNTLPSIVLAARTLLEGDDRYLISNYFPRLENVVKSTIDSVAAMSRSAEDLGRLAEAADELQGREELMT